MVLVDTSVWIDFFNSQESPYSEKLSELIKGYNRVVICGLILQEILQGIKDDRGYKATRKRLSRLPFVDTHKEAYLYAADLYRNLRRKGLTIPPIDVTIAAIAITSKLPLFTKDMHFKKIAGISELELFNI